MRVLIVLSLLVSCQAQEVTSSKSSQIASSTTVTSSDPLAPEKDESCADAEMTEEKIVQQAMKPAQANNAGALQGATDCTVE